MEDIERRAKHCTTHHHACDCREWYHLQALNELETELAAVTKRLQEAEEILQVIALGTCSDCELGNGKCIHQQLRTFLTPPQAPEPETKPCPA